MFPPYSLAAWLAGFWYELLYSYQMPSIVIVGACTFAVIQTIDSWIRSMKKDPIALFLYAIVFCGSTAIVGQLLFHAITFSAAPISQIVTTIKESAITRSASTQSISTGPITTLLIVINSNSITWWLSKTAT